MGDLDHLTNRWTDLATRRLVQDFVTAPRPLRTVLPPLVAEPALLPAMIETAALLSYRVEEQEREEWPERVLMVESRDLDDGWSAHLLWTDPLGGLPPFDGELVLMGADPHRTWIGLEGTVLLVPHATWSNAPMRLARLEVRELLLHLAQSITAEVALPES